MADKQLTGNIGLFYASYCLSWYGWNAMPTTRNAKGPDIFVVSPDGKKVLGIQVKTLSGKNDVFIGENYDDPSVAFWVVLMNVRKDDWPMAYIIKDQDIRDGVEACKKGINTSGHLVHSDAPKEDGSVACYLSAKFLLTDSHSYADAWESIT